MNEAVKMNQRCEKSNRNKFIFYLFIIIFCNIWSIFLQSIFVDSTTEDAALSDHFAPEQI
jgi:hypothetical protein